MYRGFSLKADSLFCSNILENLKLLDDVSNLVTNRFCSNINESLMKEILIKNIVTNQSIDAEKVKGDWFPVIESDIFISHSHRDLKIVGKLTEILSDHLKLKVFVDSYVWKYSDDLVKQIERQCHEFGREVHDKIVAHVNIMLSSAITKMLNETECVIFLNTNNSLIPGEGSFSQQTDSPWIYHELFITGLLPIKFPVRKMDQKVVNEADQFQILHTVPLEHMTNLNEEEFKTWITLAKCCHSEKALDVLYNLKPAKIRKGDLYG